MSETTISGEKPQSQTISHIQSYPFVAQSLSAYSEHPLGAATINLTKALYARFAAPFTPYLRGPYNLVAPYVSAADDIGNQGLDSVDSRFPAIKSTELKTLKSCAFGLARLPFNLAEDGKKYVFATYDDEYAKCGGQGGIVMTGKAVLSTELRIAVEGFQKMRGVLGPKIEKAKKTGIEKGQEVKEKVDEQTNGN